MNAALAPAAAPAAIALRAGDLSAALAPHKPVVASPVLPRHALVHLVARDASTVTLRTCDGRHDLTTEAAGEVTGRVDVLCDAAELAEVVGRMDPARPLRVEVERTELRLTQGRRTVRLARVEGEILAPLCDPAAAPARGAWYQVEAAPLAAMLRAARRMASADTTRGSIFGVQLAVLGPWAYVGASDGVRVITLRRSCVAAPEGAVRAWGLFLSDATVGAWVDLLRRADGCAELWVPSADAHGVAYRADQSVPAAPTWEALFAALKFYGWANGKNPDAAVLRVPGASLAARTMQAEPADITGPHGYAQGMDHVVRAAPEALASALRAAVVTCDRDKSLLPVIEACVALGAAPALVVSSSSRRGSATEERVEVVEAEGNKTPAAINPRLLLEAVETARVLGEDTDVRVAWGAERQSSMWGTCAAGYSVEDAPWWVTTVGMSR